MSPRRALLRRAVVRVRVIGYLLLPGSTTVRSCEVRTINTLATKAKPRFIPARAARQGIAEIGAKEGRPALSVSSSPYPITRPLRDEPCEVSERSTGAVARGARQKGR